jgi:Ca-activated chloride channel homolog
VKLRAKYNFKALVISVIITEIMFWVLLVGVYLALLKFVPTMQFHNPKMFWALLIIPAISLFYLLAVKVKNDNINRFAESALVPYVIPDISSTRLISKFFLFRFGLSLILIALIDPKVGTKLEEVKTTGMDLFICLDVSSSMLAEDIQPNRLERSKQAIYQLIQRLEGDRIGLIVFAGQAFVQLPITTDYEAAKLFLRDIDTEILNAQGTAIGQAIDLAMESFDMKDGANKAIIVITDGEDHEDDASAAARDAAELGVVVHAIGMGSLEGAPIPIYNSQHKRTGFKKDKDGNTVITSLDELKLRDLVSEANGVFTRASGNFVGLNEIVDRIQNTEKSELETMQFKEYEHRFRVFLIIGVLLLVIDLMIADSRKKWSEDLNLFDV